MNDMIDLKTYQLINRPIHDSEDLQTMGDQLTYLLTSALGIKGAMIMAVNPKTAEFEIIASFGLSPGYVNKGPLMIKRSLLWDEDKKPILISDISLSNLLQYPEAAEKEGITAIISIPILFKKKIIGALRLYNSDPWEITESDLDALVSLAENIGLSMMYLQSVYALRSFHGMLEELHDAWELY